MPIDSHLPQADLFSLVPTFKFIYYKRTILWTRQIYFKLKTVFICSEIQPVQGEDAKREESPESLGQARPFPVAEWTGGSSSVAVLWTRIRMIRMFFGPPGSGFISKRYGSGSVNQKYRSADTDPYQNVTNLQHCSSVVSLRLNPVTYPVPSGLRP
jgi:hypothetical protein